MKNLKTKIVFTMMLLMLVALVPAVCAQGNDYSVTAEKAFEHANAYMLAFISTAADDYGKWEGASIDPKPMELYDINGQKLYYEFSVYKNSNLIGRIDISADKTLGSSLRRIEIDPKPYNAAEVMRKSIETSKTKYPTGKIVSTKLVVYDYPEIGAMTTVKDKTTGVEHRIFVDAYTLDVIPDKPTTEKENGVWSMYERVVKNKADENLKDWQSSEQFTKTLEQQANDIGININVPATEEDIKKLSNKISANSKIISPASSSYSVYWLPVSLYTQQKAYYCVPATAQMIAAYWGYSYTQDNIYKKMGGTNGDTTGIYPQKAASWYALSRNSGGLGATRSYLSSDRTIIKAKQEIDYGRPFSSHTLTHCRACKGYWVFYDGSGTDCIFLNDPAGSGSQYWEAISGSPEAQRIYVVF
jgi:hypothetical protein